MSNADKLFEACQNGVISTQRYHQLTGNTVRIDGKRDCSKYSGRQLREIDAKHARDALDAHRAAGDDLPYGPDCYLDGTPIVEDRIIDLHA